MPDTSKRTNRKSRRNFLKYTGVGMTAAIAGCTGGDEGDPESGDDAANGDDTSDDGSADDGDDAPDEENEFVFLASNAMDSPLDPALHNGSTEMMAFFNFYDTLIWFDENNEPIEQLATDWEVEDGGQTWVFDIREGVQTHDGNEVTAHDFVYSLERYVEIGLGLSGHFQGVYKNSEARDDYTLAIELENPSGEFINWCVLVHAVDSTVVRENEEDGEFGERGDWGQAYLAENVAGTGPYKLREWRREEELIYEKHDDYWGGWESNQFDVVRQRVILEDSTQQLTMQQSDADMSSDLLAPDIYTALDEEDHIDFISEPVIRLNYHNINTTRPPTDDRQFRKAMIHSIDYDINRENIYGFMEPIAGCLPDQLPGSNDDLDPYAKDEEVALEAFEQSEYTADDVNNMDFDCHVFAGSAVGMDSALLIQTAFDDLFGIDLSIKETELSELVALMSDPDTNPHITAGLANTADFPNHEQFLHFMWHPDNTMDNTGHPAGGSYWTDEELTPLLEDARLESDRERRLEMYAQAEEIVYNNYPMFFVGSNPVNYALNANVDGFSYRGAQGTERRVYEMYRTGGGRA